MTAELYQLPIIAGGALAIAYFGYWFIARPNKERYLESDNA